MDDVILQKGNRDTEPQWVKISKRARLRVWVRKGKRERGRGGGIFMDAVSGNVEILLLQWSSQWKESDRKSALVVTGCYIKAEVVHQRFAGSKYHVCFVRLLNPFHWFPPLSVLEIPYNFFPAIVFICTPTGLLLDYTTQGTHERQ